MQPVAVRPAKRSGSDQSAGELRVSFDIRQLRYAVAVADHGRFYRMSLNGVDNKGPSVHL